MLNLARRHLVLACLVPVGVCVVVLVAAVLLGPPAPAPEGVRVDESTTPSRAFAMGGRTTQLLSPGLLVPLDLTVTNDRADVLVVRRPVITVSAVAAPQADEQHPCSVSDFTVRQASAPLTIAVSAGSTRSLSDLGLPRPDWPQVGMLNRAANQDGCKGSTLTLSIAGSGEFRAP